MKESGGIDLNGIKIDKSKKHKRRVRRRVKRVRRSEVVNGKSNGTVKKIKTN